MANEYNFGVNGQYQTLNHINHLSSFDISCSTSKVCSSLFQGKWSYHRKFDLVQFDREAEKKLKDNSQVFLYI